MNNSEYQKILEVLKSINRLDLIAKPLTNRSFDEVKNILEMPEWKDEEFKSLLTPTIFPISTKNIINGIELLKEYGIDQYVTNNCLRFKTEFLKNLLDYLVDNNIDLVTYNHKTGKYSLNPILTTAKCQLKKKYNIDVELIEKGSFKKNK